MTPKFSNPSSRCQVNHESVHSHGDLPFERNPILILNEALDDLYVPYAVNEPTIENFLDDLEAFDITDQPVYWLEMSRLLELTLICAGHYADNCEFSAAGDLLVNPRKVLIHRKGHPHPVIKHRHGRLTDQLNNKLTCRELVLSQVKNEVGVEVAKPAILPYLLERIELSRHIASWYLHDVQERMKKIADTIGFLSAWSLSKFEVLHHRMQKMSVKTRRFVSDHQCNFDTAYFDRLGREIPKTIENPKAFSDFFSKSVTLGKAEDLIKFSN
jgi:hypothetical protein